ncbi:MAG: hypothetical protein ACREXY_02680 [Gammaproteobacteria bacterium]
MAKAPKASAPYVANTHISRERVDAAVQRAMSPEIVSMGDRNAARKRFHDDDQYAKQVNGRVQAEIALSSSFQAAMLQARAAEMTKTNVDLEWQMQILEGAVKRLSSGDMSGAEEMLLNQATALNTLFAFLSTRAMTNVGHSMETVELYLKLGLKCQSQARATLETIAAIKNPPIVYARQANFANGPQQVNNGTPAPPAHAAESKVEPNELSKSKVTYEAGERLDCGTLQGTGDALEGVATMGAIDRTTDGRRKSEVVP